MQIPILAVIPNPTIIYKNDNDDDKSDYLTILVVFGGYIIYIFEMIIECLPALMMENNNDDNNNDNEKEIEKIKEL